VLLQLSALPRNNKKISYYSFSGIQPIEVDGPPKLRSIFYSDVQHAICLRRPGTAAAHLVCGAAASLPPSVPRIECSLLQNTFSI
jgi:hypothetical protein